MIRDSWYVVRGTWYAIRGSWVVARGGSQFAGGRPTMANIGRMSRSGFAGARASLLLPRNPIHCRTHFPSFLISACMASGAKSISPGHVTAPCSTKTCANREGSASRTKTPAVGERTSADISTFRFLVHATFAESGRTHRPKRTPRLVLSPMPESKAVRVTSRKVGSRRLQTANSRQGASGGFVVMSF